ncbi:MAG: hypothetical protein ACXAC7_14740 [Candidatus Hodarchaeales archaeon]|jgi:hypothetical protein
MRKIEYHTNGLKLNKIIWLIFLICSSFLYGLIEILISFSLIQKPAFPGFKGDIFFGFMGFVIGAVFFNGLIKYLQNSEYTYGFQLIGSFLALLTTLFIFLTMLSHWLMQLPPIESEDFVTWAPLNDFSLIIIIAIFTSPTVIKFWFNRREKTKLNVNI